MDKDNNLNENEIKDEKEKAVDKEVEEDNENIEKTIEAKDETKEETKEVNKNNKTKLIIIITGIIIFILLISTIFAILNIENENIINGIYLENVNISNLNKEEANKLVNDKLLKIEEVEIKYGEYDTILKLSEIGVEIEAKEQLQKAFNIGKSNNILLDNYSILKTNLLKTRFDLTINIKEDKLNEVIKDIQVEMPEAVKDYSYEIKDKELIITNGVNGKAIKTDEFKKLLIKNIKEQFNGNVEIIELPVTNAEPEKINIQKIYNEIYKEAKDAYIEEEPFKLYKDEKGVDFAISMEEAKEIVKEEKESYIIPLKITEAKTKVKDLGDKLFKQTLAKFTTIYDAGNTNRASNIALAAKTINGTILLPGETFSYNGKLGNTTKEKGYKEGGAYVGGKVVQAYGGGICQVSSTLYNAVLYANLEIVERHNHSYSVAYVPAGRDATVSYGGKDFKFKNSRNYPIKIEANAKNGVVSISITGIKEEKEYEIVLSSTVLSTTPCEITYENNPSLAEGKQKVIQSGHNGQKSIAYKTIKYNGSTISKTVLSKDTYKPMNKIIQVGTKKVSTTPTVAEPTVTEQPVAPTTQPETENTAN